jgi:hypothetical protein
VTGPSLFLDKLRRRPGRAVLDLTIDIWLWAMRGPLGLLGRATGRATKLALIGAVARVARG